MFKGMVCGTWLLAFASLVQAAPTLHPLLQAVDSRNTKAPLLQSWARAKDPARRAQVAVLYGRMQHPDVVVPLLVLLQDKAAKVRAAAAFGLGLLGWRRAWTGMHRPHIIAALQSRLSDPSPRVRRRVLEALAKYAPKDMEKLIEPFLSTADPAIQVEALRALFRAKVRRRSMSVKKKLTPIKANTLQQLTALAKSPSEEVRRQVAYYFARVKDPRGLDILLALAKDKALWTRYFALFALRKLAAPKAAAVALASTTHANYIIRVAAIQTVAASKSAAKLPLALGKDASFHVRAALAAAYGAVTTPSPQIVQLLHQLRQRDPYITVRAAALGALARIHGKKKPAAVNGWLRAALKHPSWVMREAAVSASRHLGKQRPAFLTLAHKDKDPRVKAAAILALGKQKGKPAFEALKKALASPHLAVRGYAASAMTKRKEADASAQLWATYKRSLASKWIELREEIVKALVLRKKTPTAWLKEMAKDNASAVAYMAINALKKRDVQNTATPPIKGFKFSPHRALANGYLKQAKAAAPVVVLVTNRGTMEITTTPQAAPIHVANFVGRVAQGKYNGLGWHRVISNFVIQGGDPDGSGWGDGGYQLRAEINRERYRRGTLGMPRGTGWNTGSVQLFFTHTPTPHLDGRYTVFGHVTKGLDVIDKIEKGDKIIKAYVKAAKPTPRKAAKPATRKAAKPTKPAPRKAAKPAKAAPRKAAKPAPRKAASKPTSRPKK